jgi:hypothetical protein
MKSMIRAAMVAGLLVATSGQVIQAQQAQRVVTFRAPFAFQVEDTKLAAGDYIILEQAGWVQIQTKDGKGKMQVLTLPVSSRGQQAPETSQVVFHNYAGHLYLAQIWASGQEKGRELLESKEEQQLAKREKMAAVSVPATSTSGK